MAYISPLNKAYRGEKINSSVKTDMQKCKSVKNVKKLARYQLKKVVWDGIPIPEDFDIENGKL